MVRTRLRDKVAVVTGGSQGIGEAIATGYAEQGARVAIAFSRNDANAARVVADIAAQGGTARAFKADCSEVAQIRRVVDEIAAHFGTIDILVNNAGAFLTVSVEDTTEDIWDRQVDLNLKGTFFFSQAVLPFFRNNGRGKITTISSIAGVSAFPNCAAYCASKGGVVNLTKALAVELAKDGINVNSIAPGNVATPINQHLRGPWQRSLCSNGARPHPDRTGVHGYAGHGRRRVVPGEPGRRRCPRGHLDGRRRMGRLSGP